MAVNLALPIPWRWVKGTWEKQFINMPITSTCNTGALNSENSADIHKPIISYAKIYNTNTIGKSGMKINNNERQNNFTLAEPLMPAFEKMGKIVAVIAAGIIHNLVVISWGVT